MPITLAVLKIGQFGGGGHAALCTGFGDGKCGGGTGLLHCRRDALLPKHRQRGVEGVAGAGGVDGVYLKCALAVQNAGVVIIKCAVAAQGHHHLAAGLAD